MKTNSEIHIIDALRTPRAKRKSIYADLHAVDLLSLPLSALRDRYNLGAENLADVAVGCVTQVSEQAWCVGRKAVLASGLSYKIPAYTINRLCASGLQACNNIHDSLRNFDQPQLAIGAGVEHMTRVPMFSDGQDAGVSPLVEKHFPGLKDQGPSCELLAEKYKITREQADSYAYRSQIRAAAAQEAGKFQPAIIPVQVAGSTYSEDNLIRASTTPEKLAGLNPVFTHDGILTAGNSSAIASGSAAVLFANNAAVEELKLTPKGRIVAHSVVGCDPYTMLEGPIPASRELLRQSGLSVSDIDLWEINEAFAPVAIAAIAELGLDPAIVNVNGGAIALGHPLGATGAILLGTALDELALRKQRYAVVTLCIGLGMGVATLIENYSV